MAKEDYVKLYRGLSRTSQEYVSTGRRDNPGYLDSAGIHWTPDYNIAKQFASIKGYATGYQDKEAKPQGVVLEGMVHKRHLIDYNSEEGQRYASRYKIEEPDPEGTENEVTVRRKAPVLVTKQYLIGDQFDESKPLTKELPWRMNA